MGKLVLLAVLTIMVLALAGCNLESDDATAIVPVTATPGSNLPPSTTPNPFSTPNTTTDGGCISRGDWFQYEVQPGDNLTILADLTGTTVEALVQANCLQNPDDIFVGQIIVVPVPILVEDVPTLVSCDTSLYATNGFDYLEVTPFLSYDGASCYGLQSGSTLIVSWPGAPVGTTEVTFYRNNNVLTRPDVIGVDSNPADGFSIAWLVSDPNMPPSALYAIGFGSISVDTDAIGIFIVQ